MNVELPAQLAVLIPARAEDGYEDLFRRFPAALERNLNALNVETVTVLDSVEKITTWEEFEEKFSPNGSEDALTESLFEKGNVVYHLLFTVSEKN